MYSYRVEQAIRAASALHKDQVRKGTVPYPYISHLFAVATIISDYTDDEDMFIAALLHDTVEDTDYTFAELEQDFGPHIRDVVSYISEPDAPAGKTFSWREKKEAYIEQLTRAPEAALMVAAADKMHNMRSMVEEYMHEPERVQKRI